MIVSFNLVQLLSFETFSFVFLYDKFTHIESYAGKLFIIKHFLFILLKCLKGQIFNYSFTNSREYRSVASARHQLCTIVAAVLGYGIALLGAWV